MTKITIFFVKLSYVKKIVGNLAYGILYCVYDSACQECVQHSHSKDMSEKLENSGCLSSPREEKNIVE